jgi:tetratricopeptide (TPR) repeat protein
VAADEILKSNPNDLDALLIKGRSLLAQGKPAEAVPVLRKAADAHRESPQPLQFLGLALLQGHKPQEAEAAWNDAVRVRPDFMPAYLSLVQMKMAARDTSAAARYARQALANNPQSVDAMSSLGTVLLAMKDYRGAVEQLEAAAKIEPNNPAIRTRLGRAYAGQGNPAKAEAEFNQALALKPDDVDSLTALAGLYVGQKRPDKAVQRINQEIAKSPSSSQYYELLGQVYASQQDFPKAEAAYRKALSVNPDSVRAYGLLGQLYVVQKAPDRAIQEYESLLKVDPRSPQVHTILGYIYDAQGNHEKAKLNYREALKTDPQFVVAANNLAYRLAEDGADLDEALKLAELAHRRLPDSPTATDTLAWVQYKRGAYRTAIDLLEECTSGEPQNPVYKYHLGMSYLRLGERVKARNLLKEALDLSPSFPGSADARAALAKL